MNSDYNAQDRGGEAEASHSRPGESSLLPHLAPTASKVPPGPPHSLPCGARHSPSLPRATSSSGGSRSCLQQREMRAPGIVFPSRHGRERLPSRSRALASSWRSFSLWISERLPEAVTTWVCDAFMCVEVVGAFEVSYLRHGYWCVCQCLQNHLCVHVGIYISVDPRLSVENISVYTGCACTGE